MTIPQLAMLTVAFQQGALMSDSEIRKMFRWIEVQTSWERQQFQMELDRLEVEGMRGERSL